MFLVTMVTRNLVTASQFMPLLKVFRYERFELQMDMPMPMMFDMWVWLSLLTAILILAVVVSVYLVSRPSQRVPSTAPPPPPPPQPPIVENPHAITFAEPEKAVARTDELRKAVEMVRPTITDDERRILNEIVKAGGEILQSDLPEKSDFSKATVSKLIKSLETMGVVTREKHKWTYWVRISDKLISRTKNA